jgi:hypothetical protein
VARASELVHHRERLDRSLRQEGALETTCTVNAIEFGAENASIQLKITSYDQLGWQHALVENAWNSTGTQ